MRLHGGPSAYPRQLTASRRRLPAEGIRKPVIQPGQEAGVPTACGCLQTGFAKSTIASRDVFFATPFSEYLRLP